MNDNFEKYLGNFAPTVPSEEFKKRILTASRLAWKSRSVPSSVLSFFFSTRFLLWTEAAMIAAAVALIYVENTRTDQLLAETRVETVNGKENDLAQLFSEIGLDKAYIKRMITVKRIYVANITKLPNFADYQKTINTIMEEGTIQ